MIDTLRAVLVLGAAVCLFFGTAQVVIGTTAGYRGENYPMADVATIKALLYYLGTCVLIVIASRLRGAKP